VSLKEFSMKNRDDAFAAVSIGLLIPLMAWGNAIAMMVVTALGLVIGLPCFEDVAPAAGSWQQWWVSRSPLQLPWPCFGAETIENRRQSQDGADVSW
jgi:hypothetical protein